MRTGSTPPKAGPTSSETARSEEAESDTHLEAIREFLDKLSPDELEALESAALEQASPFLSRGYKRSKSGSNQQFIQKYREIIIEKHVQKLLRTTINPMSDERD